MSRFLKYLLLFGIIAVARPVAAATLSIATGVDGGGSALTSGSTDSNWQISVQGGAFEDATVAYPNQICCSMDTISAGAWLTDSSVTSNSSTTGWGVGTDAVLRTQFDLTGADLTTAVLSGFYRVVDFAYGIYLNGDLIAGTNDGATSWSLDRTFADVTTGFVDGINTLTIVGRSGNSTWDGFWFDGEVVYEMDSVSEVPLPAGFPLMLVGLGAFALVRRRTA